MGRFIPAILLKCEDFVSFLPAIRTSCNAYCRPLGVIIRYRMVHSPSGEYWYVYSASHRRILVCLFMQNGSHTDRVGCFIPAILLKCEDFVSFLPAIRTSCRHYCRPIGVIIRYRMVHSPSLPAIGEYWYVYSCKMAAILT